MSALGRIDQLLDAPLVAALDRLDITSRRPLQGTRQGERRSRRRGQGMEFADFRPYAPGDDLRFVDWNIYGRIERLFLRIFLEEEDLSLVVAVDESASMGFGTPSKFDVARRIAMALGYVGLVNQHRVTLAGLRGDRAERLEGLRGRRKASEAASWLLGRQPGGALDFAAAVRDMASSRHGRGIAVIVGDFLCEQGLDAGLQALRVRGWDTFALQVLAPEDIAPGAHGVVGDLRLVDSELSSEVEVTVSEALLREHRRRLEAHNAKLRDLCARMGARHLTIDTTADLPRLMLESLRRGGLLR
jgi:uncharacterized protein (DUF58 family)